MINFPEVRVARGGIQYERVPDPARDAATARLRRLATAHAHARAQAIDRACLTARDNGWDLHVYEPPTVYHIHADSEADVRRLRHVGLRFTPARYPIPTIHHHHVDATWDDDEDWSER